MRNIILAAFAVSAFVAAGAVAKADEFGGQNQVSNSSVPYSEFGNSNQENQSFGAYMDHQAANAELSDPTAPNSIRSHGNR